MLNDNIKKLRQANNMTQVELAEQLGVSKQCVSNWENDYIQPSIDMLIRIAEYFKTSTDYLLDLKNDVYLDVSGLDDKTVAHLRMLVDDLLHK